MKIKTYLSIIFIGLWLILSAIPQVAFAEPDNTPEGKKLFDKFIKLYNATGLEDEFYEAADKLKDYYRSKNNLAEYYRTESDVALYEIEINKPNEALKRANKMIDDMKKDGYDAYSTVYSTLGSIYESRGNYRMAEYYYDEAINNCDENDEEAIMPFYYRMAYLQMLRNPDKATQYNNKYYKTSLNSPIYYLQYLYINCIIAFSVNSERDFSENYDAFNTYEKQHPVGKGYGKKVLYALSLYFEKEYDQALQQLENAKEDMSDLFRCDMTLMMLQRLDRYEEAYNTAMKRSEFIDSLNTELSFSTLNEINANTGIAQARHHADTERDLMFIIFLVMAVIIIVMMTFATIRYRKSRHNLKEKNEQLKTTLKMAEEADKMKTEFVRSVSHEIRTPLNAINGFNEILNNPDIPLGEEERSDLLNRIKENVEAITNIVDEMLHLAEKESNEYYPKSGTILCNQFFSNLLYRNRPHVNANIELIYTTKVINRFAITTNKDGVEKIMDHLIQNAIKFTSKGTITVHCEPSYDNKNLLISVTDTGRGIQEDQREHIFEQFYKVDSFEQGIGLGLTVSKKIAVKLGGDLTLDENYNKGARFILSLPIEE